MSASKACGEKRPANMGKAKDESNSAFSKGRNEAFRLHDQPYMETEADPASCSFSNMAVFQGDDGPPPGGPSHQGNFNWTHRSHSYSLA